MELEVWKDIPSYEGFYKVSSLGRVFSEKRRGSVGGILKPSTDGNGYNFVGLAKNGRKNMKVSVLVAIAFLGHIPDKTNSIVVDHKDRDRKNDRLTNLQLLTNRRNTIKDKSSKYGLGIGVHFNKTTNQLSSSIRYNGCVVYLGSFANNIDASNAYKKALKEIENGENLLEIYPKKKVFGSIYLDKRANVYQVRCKHKYIGQSKDKSKAEELLKDYIDNL